MISIFAHGFIGKKPELLLLGTNRRRKVEFDVIWERREKDRGSGEWVSIYERATFVAWDEDAEHIAERFDKGTEVTCTGTQRTSKWTPKEGPERTYKKYDLDRFNVIRRRQPSAGDSAQQPSRPQGALAQRAAPPSQQREQQKPSRDESGPASDVEGFDEDPFPGVGDEHHDDRHKPSGNEGARGGKEFIAM